MIARPILFSAPMVRALLYGNKTQTRRIIKRPLKHPGWTEYVYFGPSKNNPNCQSRVIECGPDYPDDHTDQVMCPYGAAGDRLWVRETWKPHCGGPISDEYPLGTCVKYAADFVMLKPSRWTDDEGRWCEAHEDETKWRPSIFMPRWSSRITLEIVSVRVERLQDISEADAIAEGCVKNHNGYYWGGPHAVSGLKQLATAKSAYNDLWTSINGPGSWEANPWVWVLDFKRVTP